MVDSIDVLFLVPPMSPVMRPTDIVQIFYKHSKHIEQIVPAQLGLLSIAAYLREDGFSCRYWDLCHFEGKSSLYETVADLLKRFNPKIAALTSYTANFNATLQVINIIKQIDPNVLICVGGPHVTFLDKYSIDESNGTIDVVIRGEGERTMRDLTYNYLKKNTIESLEEKVRGITTKNKRIPNQKLLNNDELSKLPRLALDLIPQKERRNTIYIPLTATRGCTYNCLFCTNSPFWEYQMRIRPPANVIEDILFAEELFPKRTVEFADTILPIRMPFFEELVALYKERVHTPIQMALTRANLTDDRRLELMKQLLSDEGIAIIGVENRNPEILKRMGKPTWEQQLQALKNLKKFSIIPIPTWMAGFCGEMLSTMHENLDALDFLNRKELVFSTILYTWIPIPGSLPFQNPKKYGVKIHTYNWDFYDRAVYPPPYSLFDTKTGETTLTQHLIWAYYLAMVALQYSWSNRRRGSKGRELSPSQAIRSILQSPNLLFFSPAGESHHTIYNDMFGEYHSLLNFLEPHEQREKKHEKESCYISTGTF